MTYLSANCSLECERMFAKKNAKESLKVWLAIKFVVKMHFKDAKEATQQKPDALFSSFIHKSKTYVAL